MLQNIHDKVKGWFAGIILGFVSLTFALWGVSNYFDHGKKDTIVATVNGNKITQSQLNDAFKQYQRQQQLIGIKLVNTPEADKAMKQKVLEALIRNEALQQGAKADDLFISNNQVQQAMLLNPLFQIDGMFSRQRFDIVLSNLMFNEKSYLQLLKQQLLLNQLQTSFIDTAFALPEDVDQTIKLADQKRNIDYAVISKANTNNENAISDKELKAYYQQHQSDFKIPAKAKLAYVILSLESVAKHTQPSKEQIKQYYQDNLANSKQTLEQATPAIKKLLAKRNAEKQFAADADKLANLSYEEPSSLTPTANALNLKIETTDYLTRDGQHSGIAANKALIEQAFSEDVYNNGYNSSVINLEDGRQVVLRVAEKVPEKIKPLSEVKTLIMEKLQQQRHYQQLQQYSNIIANDIKSGQSLANVASKYQLTWKQQRALGRESNLPVAIIENAFSVMPTQNSPAVTTAKLQNGNYAVIVVNSLVSGDPTTVTEQQKQKIKQQLAKASGAFAYEIYANGLVDEAKIENKLKE